MTKFFAPLIFVRHFFVIFSIFFLQIFINSALANSNAEPVIYNADMEEASPSGGAAGWVFDNWTIDEQGNKATLDESVSHRGKSSIKITLVQGDDGKVVQEVKVKPDTWYRFSAWVKTENVSQQDHVGANLSVIDGADYSAEVKGNSDWQELEAWGQTGPEQTTLKLAVRLGFYGSLATGTAWFDDVSLIQSEPPAGSKIINFISHATPPSEDRPVTAALAISITIGVTFCFLLLAWYVIRERHFLHQHFGAMIDGYKPLKNTWPVFALIFVIAALKIISAAIVDGYPADVSSFSAWAFDMYEHGFSGFYRPGYLADYPPGYMTILWFIGGMSNWFGINYGTPEFLILLKTPAMLADIIGAIFLFKIARQHTASSRQWALVAALLWLINPLAFITSSFWGQVDSIFTLFMACSLLMLERRRVLLSASLYAVAILFKPQALMIAPVAMVALFFLRDIRLQLKAVGSFVATFILVSLPFTIFHEPLWIFKLYGSTLSSYNYLTLNAFNLYSLLGQNWLPCETIFMGMQVSTWAWLLTLTALGTLLCGLIISENKQSNTGRYLFAAFAIYLLCFVLCPKIHERYLFPAAFIGFTAFAIIGDKRILWLAIGTSLTSFINTLVTLDFMLRLQSSLVPKDNFFMIVCSLANVIMLIQTMRVGYDIFLRGNIRQLIDRTPVASNTQTAFSPPTEQATKVSRNTWLTLAGICVSYSIVAFIYLGNFESPQKFWNPTVSDGSAVFDLGEIKTVNRLQYHHGLGTGEYAFAWSEDGEDWKKGQGIIVDNRFAEFRWRSIHINQQARYFKIGLSSGLLQMNELALRDTKDQLITAKQISGPEGASALFDEQNKTATVSTAFNGMYFDEIYHARSAWEILQGIDATENTHPPLGKIIIGLGVKIFGMNPFGFRFMGVLFGILMLPVFFCLSRQLLNSDKFSLIATALFAVDFMHFTQTRIATIDTYGVFFILASTYWMLRFMQSEPQHKNWNTDIKSLLICGTLFGLGVASKWIVIYHGVGLAGLYCWALWRQTKVNSTLAYTQGNINSDYSKWLIQTLVVSVIAFVIIPALIYTASYIPLMKATGQGISGMLANQTGMWDYHSKMSSTHPSSSPWYTWPIMSMPVWYYSGGEWTGPAKVSTIMAFGNPLVWYLGTIAFVCAFIWRVVLATSKNTVQKYHITESQTFVLGFILICGLTQFLPWAIIPRKLVFIYHFFASVPFIILALVWGLQRLEIYNPSRLWIRYLPWGLVGIASLLFIAYFPVISGLPVPRAWPEFINYGPVDLFF